MSEETQPITMKTLVLQQRQLVDKFQWLALKASTPPQQRDAMLSLVAAVDKLATLAGRTVGAAGETIYNIPEQ